MPVLGHSAGPRGTTSPKQRTQGEWTHDMRQCDVTETGLSINLLPCRDVSHVSDDWGVAPPSHHLYLPWHTIRDFLFIDAPLTRGSRQGDLSGFIRNTPSVRVGVCAAVLCHFQTMFPNTVSQPHFKQALLPSVCLRLPWKEKPAEDAAFPSPVFRAAVRLPTAVA